MANIRDLLFPTFSRMVGNPKSYLIHNRDELNRFASVNSSDNDQNYCSICSYYNGKPVFEDLFFETDEIMPEPVRQVALWFDKHGIPWVCLLSGNRGFHIHGLFEATIVNAKTVKAFANLILDETGTKHLFDEHVSGVLEKLCRIPNTQRKGNGWCVPITREELFTINDPAEFKKLCIAPRFLDFPIVKRAFIFDFVKEDISVDRITQQIDIAPPKEIFFIKQILRPCVYKALLTPNPKHNFRISAVVEMLNHGLNPQQIFSIFERLQWIDFDHDKTLYQIEKIVEKRAQGELMIPFGKKKLGCEKKITCLQCVFKGID